MSCYSIFWLDTTAIPNAIFSDKAAGGRVLEYSRGRVGAAPYVTFGAFHRSLISLRSCDLTKLPDVSEHVQLAPVVRSQVITALRFFRLIDKKSRPTEALKALLNNPDQSDAYRKSLRTMIIESYGLSDQLSSDGRMISAGVEARIRGYSTSPAVQSKMRRFFEEVAAESGIVLTQVNAKPREFTREIMTASGDHSSRSRRPLPPTADRAAMVGHGKNIPITDGGWLRDIPSGAANLIAGISEYVGHLDPTPEERKAACRTIRWLANLSAGGHRATS